MPTNYEGSFESADALLTKIWYTGAYTVKITQVVTCSGLNERRKNMSVHGGVESIIITCGNTWGWYYDCLLMFRFLLPSVCSSQVGKGIDSVGGYLGSELKDRGDRIAFLGDAHVTQASALVAFGNFDMLARSNNYTKDIGNDIQPYWIMWCMSVRCVFRSMIHAHQGRGLMYLDLSCVACPRACAKDAFCFGVCACLCIYVAWVHCVMVGRRSHPVIS